MSFSLHPDSPKPPRPCDRPSDSPEARIEQLQAENERLRADNQRLTSMNWQRRFYNISSELMCVADPAGHFLEVNHAFEQVLGYTADDLRSRPFLDFVHPDDREATLAEVADILKNGKHSLFRNRYLAKDGQYRWLSWVSDLDRESGHIYAVARDISEIRATARQLAALSESIPGAIYQYSQRAEEVTGHFTYFSAGLSTLYGVDRDELDQNPAVVWAVLHDDDLAPLQASLERSRADLSDWQHQYRIVTPAGETKWIQGRARPQRGEDGSTIWDGILLDVTELHRTETILRQRERRLSWLFEQSPMAAIEWNLDLTVKTLNFATERTFGFSAAASIGRHARELMWSEGSPGLSALERLSKVDWGTTTEVQVTDENCTRDGQPIHCQWFHRPLFDEDGSPISILSKAWDVSDRKLAETELLRFRHAVDSSSDAIGIADAQGRHCYHNDAFTALYGYETPEAFNDAGGIAGVFDEPHVGHQVMASLVRGEAWSGEVSQRDREGTPLDILLRANPIFDDEDRVIGYMGLNADITPLKRTQRQLEAEKAKAERSLKRLQRTQSQLIQSEKMSSLGQLVAGIAHEINNPASFIGGNLSHSHNYMNDLLALLDIYHTHYPEPVDEVADLRDELDVDFIRQDMPSLLESMKNGVRRIQTIVDSLRTFARLDEAVVKEVDLHESLDSTLTVLRSRWAPADGRPGIAIARSYGFDRQVECFAGDLNQVFANLLTNAIDAIGSRLEQGGDELGRIEISTSIASDGFVQIAIADNGSGIEAAVIESLYDPFVTTKSVGRGTGLGLSMAYQTVVEKHGGRLRHEPRPEGGTIAVVEIPVTLGQQTTLALAS